MARRGLTHGFEYVDILSRKNLEKAYQGMLNVLQSTGVVVKDRQMRKTLSDYGCRIDDVLERAYFSAKVIGRALDSAPKGFKATARDEKNDIDFESGRTTYFINACGMHIVDLDTWETREPTRREFHDHLRILDALPNVDIQNCFPFFGFAGVPECMKLLESAAAKYRVSTKVQIEGTVFDNYRFSTEMAQAMGVDLFQIVNSAAPLTYFSETADQIRTYANSNLPFHFAAGPTRGMTSPMTSLGSAISNNAEAMAGIVMAQAVRPGARVWVNSMIMTPDMRDGTVAFGDIGNSITDMVFNQMWRRCQIPCWSNAAAWTSSKSIDYQAGYEMATALVTQVMSGATAISYQGGLNAQLSVHPAKAIIDDDVVGMVKRLMSGPDTSPEAFALDLINETGPMPGSFMESDLTLMNWRNECYVPTVANRQSYGKWRSSKKNGVLDAARQKMQAILETHKIVELQPSKEQALESILRDARNYYRTKGMISDLEWKLYESDLASPNYPYA